LQEAIAKQFVEVKSAYELLLEGLAHGVYIGPGDGWGGDGDGGGGGGGGGNLQNRHGAQSSAVAAALNVVVGANDHDLSTRARDLAGTFSDAAMGRAPPSKKDSEVGFKGLSTTEG
jgi:hypothetical protein